MRARPMMNGVWILSAEFGLRPIDSMAAAVARPCPSAVPSAATPRPRPAPTAMRPRSPPPMGTVSAKAGLANNTPSTANIRLPKRFMTPLSAPPGPASPLILSAPIGPATKTYRSVMLLLVPVLVTHGARDVNGRKHRKDERLHDADEEPETVERNRDEGLREAIEDLDHGVVGEH